MFLLPRDDGKSILTLVVLFRITERTRGMAHEVRLSAETRTVVEPVALYCHGSEVVRLLP